MSCYVMSLIKTILIILIYITKNINQIFQTELRGRTQILNVKALQCSDGNKTRGCRIFGTSQGTRIAVYLDSSK